MSGESVNTEPPEGGSQGFMESFLMRVRQAMLLSSRPEDRKDHFQIRSSMSLRFGADVGWRDSGSLVYIYNWGTCLGLCDLAMTLGACKAFFDSFGGDNLEWGIIESERPVRARFHDYRPIDVSLFPEDIPLPAYRLNTERAHIGDVLFQFASIIVSLHEQGHALCGHLHYLKAHSSARAEWTEEGGPASQHAEIPQEICFAFELQADAFVFEYLFGPASEGIIAELIPESPFFAQVAEKQSNRIFLIAMAAAMFFSILEQSELATKQEQRRHPPAKVRMLAFLVTLKKTLVTSFPNEDKRTEFLVTLHRNLGVVFETVGVAPVERDAFNEYFFVETPELRHPSCVFLREGIAVLRRLEPIMEHCRLQARDEFR